MLPIYDCNCLTSTTPTDSFNVSSTVFTVGITKASPLRPTRNTLFRCSSLGWHSKTLRDMRHAITNVCSTYVQISRKTYKQNGPIVEENRDLATGQPAAAVDTWPLPPPPAGQVTVAAALGGGDFGRRVGRGLRDRTTPRVAITSLAVCPGRLC